jgi:hypothetical protein
MKKTTVTLKLSPDDIERIDALIDTISASEAAREFGVRVNRATVLRIAVIRGLNVMQAMNAPGPRQAGTAHIMEKVQDRGKVQETQETKGEAAEVAKDNTDVVRDKEGRVVPPEGWNAWKVSEQVPESQVPAHEYYMSRGWQRWWGKAGDENIAFYWTGDERVQGLEPFSGKGPGGKGILVQKTPHGPGHMVPHGWDEVRKVVKGMTNSVKGA